MRIFLGVVARKDRLDDRALHRMGVIGAPTLPFRGHPYRSERWLSRSGGMAIHAWDNATDDVAPLIDIAPDGQVALVHGGHRHDRGTRNASLLRADDTRGILDATTTLTRIAPVYWAQTRDAWLVSNRALLLACVAAPDGRPRYDLTSLAALIVDGWMRTDRTPFLGVELLAPSSTLTLTAAAARVTRPDAGDRPDGTVTPGPHDDAAFADRLSALVTADIGQDALCHLTGGRDSRLIAAALTAAGIPFHATTLGTATDPDVVIAGQVAAVLGVTHERRSRPAPGSSAAIEVDIAARTRLALFATDGMLSSQHDGAQPQGSYAPTPLRFGGQGGESLRGGYAKNVSKDLEVSWDAAQTFLMRRVAHHERLFRAGAMDDYAGCIQRWIASEQDAGYPASVALDRYYLHYRTGRWAAAMRSPHVSGSARTPLFDDWLTRFGLSLTPQAKAHDELVRRVTLRFAPRLRDIPYAGSVPSTAGSGQDDDPAMDPGWDWRLTCSTDMYPAFAGRLLDGSRHDRLFDILERGRFLRWSERRRTEANESPRVATLWWGMYAVSMLLSDEWLEPEHGLSQVAVIPVRR